MSETGSRKSVIGAGASFTGKLVKASALDIHGEVNADVSTERLHLHEGPDSREILTSSWACLLANIRVE